MLTPNTTNPREDYIEYTGSNALEVEKWAKAHGYHITGEWPGEAGKSLHLAITYPPEGLSLTAYRVDSGDRVYKGIHGPLIDHPVRPANPATAKQKPVPILGALEGIRLTPKQKSEQERDDQLRRLALEQTVKLMGGENIRTPSVLTTTDRLARSFYAFLAGKEASKEGDEK